MANFNLNKIFFAGRLTADPELRQSQSGSPVTIFNVACDRDKKPEGADQPTADFIRFTAFDQTAQFVSTYFRKGSSIFVEGRVQNHNYTDQNGQKRYEFRFVANNVKFVDSKSEADQANARSDTLNQGYQTYGAPTQQYNTGTPYQPNAYTQNTSYNQQQTQAQQVNLQPVEEDGLPF